MPAKKAGKPQLTKSRPPARAPGTITSADLGSETTPLSPMTADLAGTISLPPVPAPPPRRVPTATAASRPGVIMPPARPNVAAPIGRRPNLPPAGSSIRTQRGRMAQQIQVMDITDEMSWIRSDIARLTIFAAVGFVILIILAFVLPAMGL